MIETEMLGDFASVRAAATWPTDLAAAMTGAGDDIAAARSTSGRDWDGPSHTAYTEYVNALIRAGDDRADVIRRSGQAVETYAWELKACQSQMAGHRRRAVAGGLSVRGARSFEPSTPLAPGTPQPQSEPEKRVSRPAGVGTSPAWHLIPCGH